MKKTIFTLSLMCIMGVGYAQTASTFGAKDVLISDFETKTPIITDSLWVDSLKTTPVTTPSPFVSIADNPLPLENESAKALKFIRPKGVYKTINFRFDKNINFSETPYLQVQIYPVLGKSPVKTSINVSLVNDKGEVIGAGGSKGGIAQDEWTTVSIFVGKQKSSPKYNSIIIYINPEDSLSKLGGTEYYIDQIGFKAPADGSVLPATVFYETFGQYNQKWQDGKLDGMWKAEKGKSDIFTSIKGFDSGIPFKFMNADTMAVMEARTWGMGAKYEGPSNNGRFGLSNGLKGALMTGNIDVTGYSDLKLSFGLGTQTWWPYDGAIANARPKIEVSINGGAFYEIFSASNFLQATGEKVDKGWGLMNVYEDQIFTLVDYPITAEDGSALTAAKTIAINISYKAGSAFWIDDLWFAGKYSPTALNTAKQETFNVYPNPASKYIITKGYDKVSITDLNGRLLKEVENVEQLDISDLNNGIYIVKATKAGQVKVAKLVKK
jgi:hypothetical protein